LEEFSSYRTNLDTLTVRPNRSADLTPAFAIYKRFQKRFQQHMDYANELLAQDKFKFNTEEKIQIDRRHAPFPKDLDAAKQLWRQQVYFEYLNDKLSRELSETNGEFTINLPAGANTNIVASLQKHYRWQQLQESKHDSDYVLSVYLNSLAHAYDPHSDYMSAPHAQDFSITMNLALFGIGAQLTEDDGYCTIHSLVAGGPAAASKQLHEKDRIVAVAQSNSPPVDVVDMELEKVVQQIRGPKGAEVRLTVSPAPDFNTRKVVTLVRNEIKLEDSQAKAKIIELPDGHGGTNRLGIIDLPSFYAPVDLSANSSHATPKYTTSDVVRLIAKLKQQHVSGLIMDLRYNPGGSLEEAIKFTGLFIKQGPVVQARNPDGRVTVDSDNDPNEFYEGPMLVLLNRFSASAAEIAAAALQDYGRALVVGDISTHGKGTVQNLNPLGALASLLNVTNDPGALKITIRKFYRITGASTQLKGVQPDIILPDVLNYLQVGESNLDNPLPWDTIQAENHDKFNLVQPYLAELHKRSAARIATNQDFDYIHQDIVEYQKTQGNRTAPLNEHEAIKERERNALRNRSREKEIRARPLPPGNVYEFTVKDAVEAGLPAPRPLLATNYEVTESSAGIYSRTNLPLSQTTSNCVFVYTNFFPPEYAINFTNFFCTNYPALTDVKFVYVGSHSTNILAEQPIGASETNRVFKATVTKTFAPDPMLDESERIMEDYISLLPKGGSLTVNP
jgi:carboxyl-terminal processing protease